MEILQTIWMALTTENENLAILICTPLIFIEMYVSMLIFTTLLNIPARKNQKLIYVVILGIIGLITVWTIPAPFNTFINVIACPILVLIIFKTNVLKSIVAEIIPYIFFVVLSSFLITFFVKFTGINYESFLSVPIYKFCFSLTMYFIVYIIYLALKKFNININLFDKLKSKNNLIIFINFIIRYYCYFNSIIYLCRLYK